MDAKLKHLEFIQAVINRMATNSATIKGWSITLVVALFALAAKDASMEFVLISYLPVLLFWGLDGYYLCKERGYRELYDEVALKSDHEIDFSMKIESCSKNLSTISYRLRNNKDTNASIIICRLVDSFRSQFFHSRLHFSNHAKERSTTQRCGITAKVWSSLRLTTSTFAFNIFLISFANFSPVYPPSTIMFSTKGKWCLCLPAIAIAPSLSVTFAVVTSMA